MKGPKLVLIVIAGVMLSLAGSLALRARVASSGVFAAAAYLHTPDGNRQLVDGLRQIREEKSRQIEVGDEASDGPRILYFLTDDCVCANKALYKNVMLGSTSAKIQVDGAAWKSFSRPDFGDEPGQIVFNDIRGYAESLHRGRAPKYLGTVEFVDAAQTNLATHFLKPACHLTGFHRWLFIFAKC